MVKILVACGSGIATSTVAQEAIKKILAEANIPATMLKSTITEIPKKQKDVDVVMVTSNYTKMLDIPVIKVFGLISGINKEKIKQEIISVCSEIEAKK